MRLLMLSCFLFCCQALAGPAAHASITVLVGEPYGNFGTMMPVGHTAVYLDHLCADGPLRIRECLSGEAEGVVVARYQQLGTTDWIATPILQFLYAADQTADVPAYVTPATAWDLRQQYRREYLESLIPDGTERNKGTDEWWESAGATFNRRLWGYRLDTTPAQDRAWMEHLDSDRNVHRYRLVGTNCADFAADAVNFFFPGAVKADPVADMVFMSPKQVARSMNRYGQLHPELHPLTYQTPQLPGTLRRSRPVRGAWELLLKTKRYLVILLAIQPEIPVIATILYLKYGRFPIGQDAFTVSPEFFFQRSPAGTTEANLLPQPPR